METALFPTLPCLFLKPRSPSPRCSPHLHSPNVASSKPNGAFVVRDGAVRRTRVASWTVAEGCVDDGVGGWSGVEEATSERGNGGARRFTGFPNVLMIGMGTSAVVLAAAFAFCKFSGTRFGFHVPFLKEAATNFDSDEMKDPNDYGTIMDKNVGTVYAVAPEMEMENNGLKEKRQYVIIPAVTDSTQQAALSVLKKLKIIEDEVVGDVLCTRRQYARWLVKMNHLLERSPKHRLIPVLLVSGSSVSAFSDVDASDSDFWSMQALAHAGIIPSKLTTKSSCSGYQAEFNFSPESYISRLDLISWKTQLELPGTERTEEKISSKKISYVDLRAEDVEAFPEILLDTLAGDKSIISRVFGCSRRLQPYLPATIAQAAVALTGGKMIDAIQVELSRLDSEKLSRKIAKEDIKSEILSRGEISESWMESLSKIKALQAVVHEDLMSARSNLEEEKIVHYQTQAEFLKAKTSLECEKRLVLNLKDEVNDICERYDCETHNINLELISLEELSQDLLSKQQSLVEAKSVLEADKKSVSLLRTWVEEEAKQIGARTKVLEEAAQRWKCNVLQGTSSHS